MFSKYISYGFCSEHKQQTCLVFPSWTRPDSPSCSPQSWPRSQELPAWVCCLRGHPVWLSRSLGTWRSGESCYCCHCYCYYHCHKLLLLRLPIKNLANTAVANPELPADDAGPHPGGRHLDDLEADVVRERPAVDEDSPQLIDPPLPWKQINSHQIVRNGLVVLLTQSFPRLWS